LTRTINQHPFKRLHAARSTSALCAWLAHILTSIPFSVAIETHPILSPNLLERICRDATKTSAAHPSDIKGSHNFPDALDLHPPPPERKRLGPFRWQKKSASTGKQQRLEALHRFLA